MKGDVGLEGEQSTDLEEEEEKRLKGKEDKGCPWYFSLFRFAKIYMISLCNPKE